MSLGCVGSKLSYLCLLHDSSRTGINRRGSPSHLWGTVHWQRLAVDVLFLFAGSLHKKPQEEYNLKKNVHASRNERVCNWLIYLNGGFSLNRCTQRAASQTLLQVFLDLSQPQLQVDPLGFFGPASLIELVHTLVQRGLSAFYPTKNTDTHTQKKSRQASIMSYADYFLCEN